MKKESTFATSGSKKTYVKPETEVIRVDGDQFISASEDVEFDDEQSTSGGGQMEGGNFDELPEGSEILTRESSWDTNW